MSGPPTIGPRPLQTAERGDYEWYDVTKFGDPEPRLLRGPCVHRHREAVISLGEHVADICLNPRCLAQIDVGWWS